ncbi:uncharacterized protein L201_000547 [Kwoniella dendrophila CBS 6074]|uniref:Signal recognition particle subunit SRP68 n=1 Tax=Kwoniella dendrophila CBS 6074 TaxID=1295534 RepID=A0AAX4JJU2_9TREE
MSQVDLSFPLLSLLSKERAVYGLRNGDHERYRKHCANKIHRLRQITGQTCGKGKQYKSPPKLDINSIKDVRQLQLLLFSAERALAHSHELKAEKAKPTATSPSQSTLKKDQISWLRRSLKISTELFDLIKLIGNSSSSPSPSSSEESGLSLRINERTKAEITIYQLDIRSEILFEKSNFGECLTDLIVRRKILQILGENSKSSYDEALSLEFIDLKDPLIRYCAYKLGKKDSHDIQSIINDLDDEDTTLKESLPNLNELINNLKKELGNDVQEDRNKLNDITFGGSSKSNDNEKQKIEFRNAELVKIMSKVQETLNNFKAKSEKANSNSNSNSQKKNKNVSMRGWDKVLSVLGEAESVARRLKDDNEASGSSTSLRSSQITSSLNIAHSYIVHLLLSHRIKRDLSLIDTLSSTLTTSSPSNVSDNKIKGGKARVEEVVKGLGGIIKLLDTVLQSLRGISDLSIVQEKEGVRIGVEGLEGYYHALRCFYLARLHCLHPEPSYSSSVALIQKADISVNQSRSLLINPPNELEEVIVPITKEQIENLENDLRVLDISAKKGLYSQNIEKPVFFDMAFNYIDIPFDQLEVLSGKKQPSSTNTNSEAVVENLTIVKDKALEGIKKLGRETRETTPAVEFRPSQKGKPEPQEEEEEEDDDEVEGQTPQEGKKGWLGGWFGRGR